MTKQPKPWVESMLVAYVDNQLEPAQMAAVEEIIRDDPEARTIVAVLRRSAAAVKTAFDQPLREPVPARLLATVGATMAVVRSAATSCPCVARKLRLGRPTITALAASLAALAIGFGAGHWQAAPSGGIRVAGGSDGAESGQYEAALYQALEDSNPGTQSRLCERPPTDGTAPSPSSGRSRPMSAAIALNSFASGATLAARS